jgi:type II secretory pathway pseudopilin PulG
MLASRGASLIETLVALALLGSLLSMTAPLLGLFSHAQRTQQQQQGWLWLQSAAHQWVSQWQDPAAYAGNCLNLPSPPSPYTLQTQVAWPLETGGWSASHDTHPVCPAVPTQASPSIKRLYIGLHYPERPSLHLWILLAQPPG